jgi:molecular chaperone GrpE
MTISREQGMAERNDLQQEQEQATGPQGTEPQTTGGQDRVAELEAQLQAATEEAAQYKDRYLRERAEMENFRKRQERFASERVARYKRDLLEKVLEVMDNLDRAMRYEDSMDRESLQQGLRMVQWQLNELLRTEGLTPVAAVGEQFDPRVHEAVETVASAEHPEGTVVEEVRRGYLLAGEMMRPARVKVSTGANG